MDGKDFDTKNSGELLGDTENVVKIGAEIKYDGKAQKEVFIDDATSEPESNHCVENQNCAAHNKATPPLIKLIPSAVSELNMANDLAESETEAGNHRSGSSLNDIRGGEAGNSEHAGNKEK